VAEGIVWVGAACVAYTYVVYPLLLWAVARGWGRPVRRGDGPPWPSVTVVVAAHNEEGAIGRRVEEFRDCFAALGLDGAIVVVSDGSTDRTAEVARAHGAQVVALPENQGKAAALNAGCAAARGEVLVFADARQTWAPEALGRLLENFADPAVGGASGELVLESAPGVLAGVGLYWRFEKWLRALESRVHSTVGVTGAISAVRRARFRPIPPGTILDDVYWPLRVVMEGGRVVYDRRALAFDRLPARPRDEFRRKVRTLSGNFQLVARLPAALWPWRNPVWWPLVSHKLARLAVPWALLGMLAASAWLGGPLYGGLFAAQVAMYALALAGLHPAVAAWSRPASAAASFLILNTAAWVAFWVWATGRAGRSWRKVAYTPPPAPAGGEP
jgi:cellulose synthase/poly-beta-1,6-N-acetylglucosamine synthase-like glycosyltransferase